MGHGQLGCYRAIKVTAPCGHVLLVSIPPTRSGQPGAAGRRNIERAKNRPCWNCRQIHPGL